MEELCKGPVFDRLRRLEPDFLKRITPIDGDLINRDLGLDPKVQQVLRDKVQIVLHAAADVRFDETLKNAIQVNIRATQHLLELALKMTKLEVLFVCVCCTLIWSALSVNILGLYPCVNGLFELSAA